MCMHLSAEGSFPFKLTQMLVVRPEVGKELWLIERRKSTDESWMKAAQSWLEDATSRCGKM